MDSIADYERLVAWIATREAAEAFAAELDPGAWGHEEFVVSRNRARRRARVVLDSLAQDIRWWRVMADDVS